VDKSGEIKTGVGQRTEKEKEKEKRIEPLYPLNALALEGSRH